MRIKKGGGTSDKSRTPQLYVWEEVLEEVSSLKGKKSYAD
jgi:hypothetical protein